MPGMEAGGDRRTFTMGAAPAEEQQAHIKINERLAKTTIRRRKQTQAKHWTPNAENTNSCTDSGKVEAVPLHMHEHIHSKALHNRDGVQRASLPSSASYAKRVPSQKQAIDFAWPRRKRVRHH